MMIGAGRSGVGGFSGVMGIKIDAGLSGSLSDPMPSASRVSSSHLNVSLVMDWRYSKLLASREEVYGTFLEDGLASCRAVARPGTLDLIKLTGLMVSDEDVSGSSIE